MFLDNRVSADRRAVIRDLIAVGTMLFGSMFVGGAVYCLMAAIRSPRISPEEQQRANMRSCSWPTNDGDAFAAGSRSKSKAKPTLVSGQVTE
jgi:hypothetical protein